MYLYDFVSIANMPPNLFKGNKISKFFANAFFLKAF